MNNIFKKLTNTLDISLDHKLKQQKLKQQKLEQQKLEQQKLEQQKLEQQKLEQQKLEQQKLEEYNTHDNLNGVLNDIKNNEDNYIVVTGGIGDFLTVDYFFSLSKQYSIIFISKQSKILKKLMYAYKLPNKYYSLDFNFDLINKPGFCSSDELFTYFPVFKNIKIVNISEYFSIIEKMIKQNEKINTNNILINDKINKDIKTKYDIPDVFILVCPYTEDSRIDCIKCHKIHRKISTCKLTRNFIIDDYDTILKLCKTVNLSCVIISPILINIPNEYNNCKILNLSGKTSIFESIEISKMCTFYMGIDSFLSVIVTKIKDSNKIYIKCNNNHGRTHKKIYWFPHKLIKLYETITL